MFEDARLRIRRADQHIRDLKAALETYCRGNFCRLGVDSDADSGTSIVRMEITRELPGDIPWMLGDAIHNLRSALDLLACDIVRSGGKQPSRYTRFPIEFSRDKFIAALDTGALKPARPDLAELLTDRIKPYKGGDESLWGLQDLDLDERHRRIVPVVAVVALHNVSVRDADKKIMKIGMFDVGADGRFSLPESFGAVDISSYENASFQALFDKGSLFEGQPVVKTLQRLSQVVSGVVDAIRDASAAAASEAV